MSAIPFAEWLKALCLWCVILVLAIANGILRENILIPVLGSFSGYLASGIILSALIFIVAFLSIPWYGSIPSRYWWYIGLFWLLLTLIFELGLGRFIQHKSWTELLEAYMFNGGNIWPVVLLVTAISPWFAAKLRGLA